MNIKDEFQKFVKDKPQVKCAYISISRWNEKFDSKIEEFRWSNEDYGNSTDKFLKQIDIDCSDECRTDMYAGIIWFTDGTWAEWDFEYFERWVYKFTPLQKDYGFNK